MATPLWFETVDKGAGGVDLVEELSKLADLKQQGVLDDDEFEGLKQHLLGLDDEADDGQPAPAPAPPDPSAASAAAELSEERRRRRRERKRRKEAKAARLRQEKRGPRQPESEASRQLALIDVAETSSRIGPNQRAPVYTDELVILPTSRLKTLRTDAMVKRAVERVKTSLRSASVDDVGDWLCALGLEAYASTFKDSAVDGQLLAELTDDQLRDDLSVHKIGDRAKIRRARDAILSGQVTSLKGVDGGADQADAIISPSEEAKKQRRWLGHERIKVQARLSSADPWMNMKISAGELGNDLEQFRERLASSLQVHESALGHLEYMDTNGDWFACMNEYDVWDGVAEQGGRALVLQVVEARAPGFQVGEAFDHDGRRSLVDVAPGGGGGPEMSQPKDMQLSLDGSLGTAAEGGFGGTGRPESTEQLNLLMKALLRRGAIDDAVAELKSWLGARGQKLTEQPYNTLLKLALDDHLPSSAATSILNSMEDSGVTVGARSYQYALRILVASGDLQDAADILRKMEGKGVQPDSAAYEKLVQGLAERGDLDMSLLLAKQASKAGTRLGINCLGFLLNSCTQKKAKQQGLATFKLIQKAKLGITQEIFASVIKCACAAGDLEMASDLLKDSIAARHTPGILTFNAVLKLCTDQKANNEAVRTFKRLSKAPAEADEESYGLLLQCTSTTGDLALSSKILQEMVSLGFYPSILTCNNLLAMCADQHARTEAVSIFKYMQMSSAAGLSPNAQSYEYLIAVGVNVNDTQFVVQVVKHMVSAGFAPTAARASELLDVCAQNRGQGAQVLSLYKLMQSIALQAERLEGDPFPYAALIDCACIYEDMDLATKTLKVALLNRCKVDTGVVGSLIMDRAQTSVKEALELLQLLISSKRLPSREVIVYFLEQCQRQTLEVNTVQQMGAFFIVMRDRGFALEGELKAAFRAIKVAVLGEDSDEEGDDPVPEESAKLLLVDNAPIEFHVADFGARSATLRDSRAVWANPSMAEGPLQNKRAIKNAIAVVGRGVVPFLDKVQLCRKAGAVAVVIVNTDDSILECAGGDGDEEVKIPVVCVTKTAGRVFSTSAAVTVDLVYTEADAPQLNDDDDASSIGRPDGSEVSSRSSSSSGSDSDSASGSDSRDASTRDTGSSSNSSGSSTAQDTSSPGSSTREASTAQSFELNSDDGTASTGSSSGGSSASTNSSRSSRSKTTATSRTSRTSGSSRTRSSSGSNDGGEWLEAYDEQRKRKYYYHSQTNEVRWSKP